MVLGTFVITIILIVIMVVSSGHNHFQTKVVFLLNLQVLILDS